MLVMISDIHFSDGSIGDKSNVSARAFKYLKQDITTLIENPRMKVSNIEIVLLGDVFDLLRSDKWTDGGPMPWSSHDDALESLISSILHDACETNASALEAIRELKTIDGIENISITYIPGNHDRELNWFSSTRKKAMAALGMAADPARELPWEYKSADYGVFAIHGDTHDPTNWGGGHDKSCLGDAVVIKLLNGIPDILEAHIASIPDSRWILEKAAQLDHLRPCQAIPAWMQALYSEIAVRNPENAPRLQHALKSAWNESVDLFLSDPFVKKLDHPWNPFEAIDALRLLLRAPLDMAENLAKLVDKLNLGAGVGNIFSKAASREPALDDPKIDFIVYGHTHQALQLPLDVRGDRNLMYINTGAWRKTVNQAAYAAGSDRRFIPWEIMAYPVFYKKGENRNYRYELWQGARG